MATIIKSGDKDNYLKQKKAEAVLKLKSWSKKITCHKCGCVFEIDINDFYDSAYLSHGQDYCIMHYYTDCPHCKETFDFLQDSLFGSHNEYDTTYLNELLDTKRIERERQAAAQNPPKVKKRSFLGEFFDI